MFKLITTEYKIIIKSYDIYELWKFIVSNPNFSYQFLKDYDSLTTDEFLKYFLNETKNYPDYLRIYVILNPIKTIFDYDKIKTTRRNS